MKSFGFLAMFTVTALSAALSAGGCAKAGLAGQDAGGGGGDVDMSVDPAPVDLAGIDLAGWDLRPDPRDLAGLDLRPPPCNVFPQSGCNPGEKCQLAGSSAFCVADGNKNIGQLCGPSTDDCVKSALCTSESATVEQCRGYCASDGDCTATPVNGIGGKCIVTLQNASQKLCTVPCNPIVNQTSGCAPGLGCEVFGLPGGGGTQGTDCSVRGAGVDGSDCSANGNGDCASGLTCVTVTGGPTTVKKCRRVCRVNTAADCSGLAGYACLAPSGTPTYGFCCPGAGCQ